MAVQDHWRKGVIYKAVNKINGHTYVGQTIRGVDCRWRQHCNIAKHSSTTTLSYAIRKYGEGAFRLEMLEECSESNLNEREIFWIKHLGTYKDGYNCTEGGSQPPSRLGKKIGTEGRKRIADGHRGIQNGSAKLDDHKVAQMRSEYVYTDVTIRVLAKKFEVSYKSAWGVVSGTNWKHVLELREESARKCNRSRNRPNAQT